MSYPVLDPPPHVELSVVHPSQHVEEFIVDPPQPQYNIMESMNIRIRFKAYSHSIKLQQVCVQVCVDVTYWYRQFSMASRIFMIQFRWYQMM